MADTLDLHVYKNDTIDAERLNEIIDELMKTMDDSDLFNQKLMDLLKNNNYSVNGNVTGHVTIDSDKNEENGGTSINMIGSTAQMVINGGENTNNSPKIILNGSKYKTSDVNLKGSLKLFSSDNTEVMLGNKINGKPQFTLDGKPIHYGTVSEELQKLHEPTIQNDVFRFPSLEFDETGHIKNIVTTELRVPDVKIASNTVKGIMSVAGSSSNKDPLSITNGELSLNTSFFTSRFLGLNDTAQNASKLGNRNASDYALKSDLSSLSNLTNNIAFCYINNYNVNRFNTYYNTYSYYTIDKVENYMQYQHNLRRTGDSNISSYVEDRFGNNIVCHNCSAYRPGYKHVNDRFDSRNIYCKLGGSPTGRWLILIDGMIYGISNGGDYLIWSAETYSDATQGGLVYGMIYHTLLAIAC